MSLHSITLSHKTPHAHVRRDLARMQASRGELAAALLERGSLAGEVQHLRQQLQQRDAEVAQLRLQVGPCGMLAGCASAWHGLAKTWSA